MGPETDPTTHDTRRRVTLRGRLWTALLDFWAVRVRMPVFVLTAAIFAVVTFAVKTTVERVDQRSRAADRRDALALAYAADVRTYDLAVQARADCLDRVERSDLNRGQHRAIVEAFENLKALFPDSESLAVAVDQIVADLESGPLLSAEALDSSDCPAQPAAPVKPGELEEEGIE